MALVIVGLVQRSCFFGRIGVRRHERRTASGINAQPEVSHWLIEYIFLALSAFDVDAGEPITSQNTF